ncbi:Nif3-like dinuclear metal center hexameric protein [Legionella israelensis]|uniref:Nif3-like dinuclear metal center hexameric protein n=1 Tax=Legionella israelensis TaxID=454 RepID=UPI001180B30C|nr:Nif3-like dinuclear metal center hexameric protein [Legionella israelensis]
MIARDILKNYLHTLLCCEDFADYSPNGMQIEGKPQINKICTAVTASKEVIAQAIEENADAIIVHHGYFWKGEEPVITGMKYQRIKAIMNHNISLFAYHLPLDCHPEYGNNVRLGRLLNIYECQQHNAGKIRNLLWSGVLSEAINAEQFRKQLNQKLQREPLHVTAHDKPIRRIAWCTGAAQDFIIDAAQLGADAYISGEISERTYYQALELGIHYFSCGHHATERYGVQALGQHLAESFALEHQYIETNNPV